jgi:TetR/AcrR family transcriptional regulator, cholesterol catabolism regulator
VVVGITRTGQLSVSESGVTDDTAASVAAGEPSAADARRAAVVALAADLFDRGGYASISMEQIAAAAGIAKPTLYHYFRSKDEILRGVHESFIGILLERQDERVRLGLAPADLLLGAMTDIFGLMETHRGYVRVFFEHYRELPDEARREIRVKRDRYEGLIRNAVAQGIRAGAFRGVDPDAATMAVFGICNWAYQWWRPGGGADPALMAQKMWDLVIRGLSVPHQDPQSLADGPRAAERDGT